MKRLHAAVLVAAFSVCALARAADAPVDPGAGASLAQTTLGLAVVLALIFAVAWLLRRVGPMARTGGSPLRIVASQAVGQRERIVIVELGEQWLVLGVAPGRVNTLSTLPRGTLPEGPSASPFATMLARATGKDRK
jgi:flagellar protein FliO/FliZ